MLSLNVVIIRVGYNSYNSVGKILQIKCVK